MLKKQDKRTYLANVGLASSLIAGAVLVLWGIFYFGIYLGYGNWQARKQQDFARNGVSQIQPALEMEELFDDCRHHIVCKGKEAVSTWKTTAFFGNRYKIVMEVPVAIKSKDSGSMIGDPKFYLFEVDSITTTPSGQLSVTYSRDFEFFSLDKYQWRKIYDSGGDFRSIGCILNSTPVSNFQQYTDSFRPQN